MGPTGEVERVAPGRSLPPGKQWIGHCGAKARARYLRQSLNRAYSITRRCTIKDGVAVPTAEALATKAALERLIRAVANEPDPQAGAEQLAHAAWLPVDGHWAKGQRVKVAATWAESINFILDEFDRRAAEPAA